MSANPSYFPTRLAEAVTVDRCGSIVNQLTALEAEPSAKRYAASRQQRRQLALDLVNEAQKIVDRLADAPKPRARAAKPTVAKPVEAPAPTEATA